MIYGFPTLARVASEEGREDLEKNRPLFPRCEHRALSAGQGRAWCRRHVTEEPADKAATTEHV